jgi:hypothetical protein
MGVLAPVLGRERAQRAIAAAIDAAAAGRATFTESLRADADVAAALGAGAGSLENPEQYLGSAEAFSPPLCSESSAHALTENTLRHHGRSTA